MYKKWSEKISNEDMAIILSEPNVYNENIKSWLKDSKIKEMFFHVSVSEYLNKKNKKIYNYMYEQLSSEMKDDLKMFSLFIYQVQSKFDFKSMTSTVKQYKLFEKWRDKELSNMEKRLNVEKNLSLHKTDSFEILNKYIYNENENSFFDTGSLKKDNIVDVVLFNLLQIGNNKELINQDELLYHRGFANKIYKNNNFYQLKDIRKVWISLTENDILKNDIFYSELYSTIQKYYNRIKDTKKIQDYNSQLLKFIVNNEDFLSFLDLIKLSLDKLSLEQKSQFNLDNIVLVSELNKILKKNNEPEFYSLDIKSKEPNFSIEPLEIKLAFDFIYNYLDIIKALNQIDSKVRDSYKIKISLEDLAISSREDNLNLDIEVTEIDNLHIKVTISTNDYNYEDLKKVMNIYFKSLTQEKSLEAEDCIEFLEKEILKKDIKKESSQVRKPLIKKF